FLRHPGLRDRGQSKLRCPAKLSLRIFPVHGLDAPNCSQGLIERVRLALRPPPKEFFEIGITSRFAQRSLEQADGGPVETNAFAFARLDDGSLDVRRQVPKGDRHISQCSTTCCISHHTVKHSSVRAAGRCGSHERAARKVVSSNLTRSTNQR